MQYLLRTNSKTKKKFFTREITVIASDQTNVELLIANSLKNLISEVEFNEIDVLMKRISALTKLELKCSDNGIVMRREIEPPIVHVADDCKNGLYNLELEFLTTPYSFKKIKGLRITESAKDFINSYQLSTGSNPGILSRLIGADLKL